MNKENRYLKKRKYKASMQSIFFYLFRCFPIKNRKIVCCTIEGTTGYTCNPKYIAKELIRRNRGYEIVWLVNDTTKEFPKEIKVVKNTLIRRAYELSTAHFWIDNSRKQLEVRKRKGQIYLQTWHAKVGFKPTCLDRGASFSRIAYEVSKHDSMMIDYVLSNSKWYDDTLATGMLYEGATLKVGSPRCDILIQQQAKCATEIRKKYALKEETKILMYAPTFRGGNQGTNRSISVSQQFPDLQKLREALTLKFGNEWVVLLRLHPQLAARNIELKLGQSHVIDVSKVDDMYELLAGCDAFMTDYSSAAFDAAVMNIPIFLFVEDYKEYIKERGQLLWDLKQLPFQMATNQEELEQVILEFDEEQYKEELKSFFAEIQMIEDGTASEKVVNMIEKAAGDQ